jgi:hypothetical protein
VRVFILPNLKRNISSGYVMARTLAAIGLFAVTTIGFAMYPNWIAQREANAFCAEIAIHSDVVTAINKMNEIRQPHHYWIEKKTAYRFVFRGWLVDFAYCEVALNNDGKVVKKRTGMVYE